MNQHALLRKYESELQNLRAQLSVRSKNLVDQTALLKLEQERQ